MNEIDANAKIIFFGVTRFDERERFFFSIGIVYIMKVEQKAFLVCPLGQLMLLNKYLIMHGASFSLMYYDKSE